MKKKQKKIVYWAIGIIVVILLAFVVYKGLGYFIYTTPGAQSLTQFAGVVSDESMTWYAGATPFKPVDAGEVNLYNYKLVTVMESGRFTVEHRGDSYCTPISECANGVVKRVDSNNCTIWEVTSGQAYCDPNRAETLETSNCDLVKPYAVSSPCCIVYENLGYAYNNAMGWRSYDVPVLHRSVVSECGGLKSDVTSTEEGRGCWGTYSIYKDGTLFKSFEKTMKPVHYALDEFNVDFRANAYFKDPGYGCYYIENDVGYQPADSKLSSTYTTSKNDGVSVDLKITNNLRQIVANVIVNYSIQTAIGSQDNTVEKYINLSTGNNDVSFNLNLTNYKGVITVTPYVAYLYPANKISGVNTQCYKVSNTKIHNIADCQYIVAKLEDLTSTTINTEETTSSSTTTTSTSIIVGLVVVGAVYFFMTRKVKGRRRKK